ncbi:hypothetical protein BCR35DRAFT_315879 [Leucosporidium creatinivorum]|uniref:Uncharacterized protein n=1 Tax=Leucosporidium creatinivorum TaxID=106004 RepID=A0A1Y2DD55_9BASI|nr:hypothetical protein BCR35DRAFT_315879 [Leucosporidium creatinivorum]
MALRPAPPGVAALREHFQHASLLYYFPPLPDRLSKEDYFNAFAVRDHIAQLFLGEHPFFERPTPLDQERKEVEDLCRLILEQGETQRANLEKRKYRGVASVAALRNTIDSTEREKWQVQKRPFCRLFLNDNAASILYGFVQNVAYYMAENHHRNPHSHISPEIWLGFEHWPSLDPYTKALVLRRAKAYAAMEKTAYLLETQRNLSAPSSSAQEQSLAHQHLPSLTSRQSRRSAVSQEELRARWESP